MFKFLQEWALTAHQTKTAETTTSAPPDLAWLQQQSPSLERVALALACPFRSFFIDHPPWLHTYAFGCLNADEGDHLERYVARDFHVYDAVSLERVLARAQKALPHPVFRASACLYLITAAIDLGYTDFPAQQVRCRNFIRLIVDSGIASWPAFADAFMAGNNVNQGLGKQLICKHIDSHLLQHADSPWRHLPWPALAALAVAPPLERQAPLANSGLAASNGSPISGSSQS